MVTTFVVATLLALGSATPATGQDPAQTPPATAEKPWPPTGVYRLSDGVTAPRLTKDIKPNYPPAAMQQKIQGRVVLELVVKTDGTVGDVRVTRSLDKKYGLDDEAVECVKQWLFAPGKKDGKAVPVVVEVELGFALGPRVGRSTRPR